MFVRLESGGFWVSPLQEGILLGQPLCNMELDTGPFLKVNGGSCLFHTRGSCMGYMVDRNETNKNVKLVNRRNSTNMFSQYT